MERETQAGPIEIGLSVLAGLRLGCSNSRDNNNRCSGWFYWKFVDYVDKPTF